MSGHTEADEFGGGILGICAVGIPRHRESVYSVHRNEGVENGGYPRNPEQKDEDRGGEVEFPRRRLEEVQVNLRLWSPETPQ